MGAAVIFPNAFDPMQHEVVKLKRVQSIGRFVRRTQRRRTVVREVGGRRLRVFVQPTLVQLNGRPVLRRDWSTTMIGPLDVVYFRALPAGGQGGSNPLGAILAIAVAIAVPVVGPMLGAALGFAAGSLGAALVTAGVGLALSAIAYGITSLFVQPPPAATPMMQQSYGGVASTPTSPTYSAQAQGNVARLGQPIPELIGRHQIYPDFVMEPYSRFVGNYQYLHMHLGLSMGELEIEEQRLGDTPFSSFSSIEWEKIEPGADPDIAICDPRLLLCRDLAQVELPDSAAGSPWKGPFAANPSGTTIDHIEIDLAAVRGLWKFNTATGGLNAMTITVEVEAQQIDDDGATVGAAFTLGAIVKTATSRELLRWTDGFDVAAGRWQIRLRRTDLKDNDIQAGHQADWIGMRGRLTTLRRYHGMTVVGVKMKVDGDINGQTSRRVNFIATRKLPTWDDVAGRMGTVLAATRNPCDAFAHIARTANGGRLADDRIALAELYAHRDQFAADNWTFDFVFDQPQTTFEALSKVGRAVIGQVVPQAGRVHLVRDVPHDGVPVQMFSMQNIRKGSFKCEWKMVDEQTADALVGTYMDTKSWKQVTATVAYDDSPQDNPSNLQLHGVTYRPQGRAVLWNWMRGNYLRRRVLTWETEMEGLMTRFGAPISLTHDVPRYGQSAEIVAFGGNSRIATLNEPMAFTEGVQHYVAIRNRFGDKSGAFEAFPVDGEPMQIRIGEGELPQIFTGGDRERTFIQFGPGEDYAANLLVMSVRPIGDSHARIEAMDDDPAMHDPIPDEVLPGEGGEGGVGAPAGPLEIHVAANTANLNLRALADANGYTGTAGQQVTIVIDPGVHVYATGTGLPALIRGTWPGGYQPILVNQGTISGAGGAGGNFSAGGGNGGTALDASSGPLRIDNTGGTIRGGGGAGGGGGNSGHSAAGGGGGGAGFNNAPGGLGYTGTGAPGSNGGNGSSGGPGGGGAGVTQDVYETVGNDENGPILVFDHTCSGGNGGDGGGYGQPGQPGTNGNPDFGAGNGGGGAAGHAVTGNANIVWDNVGTRTGPIA